jgi:hypothetical protein
MSPLLLGIAYLLYSSSKFGLLKALSVLCSHDAVEHLAEQVGIAVMTGV